MWTFKALIINPQLVETGRPQGVNMGLIPSLSVDLKGRVWLSPLCAALLHSSF